VRELAPRDAEARWLDQYELVAEIATGGMATVYLARLASAGDDGTSPALPERGRNQGERFVAIKRLHPHLAYEPEFVEMLLDEARLVARIHHSNVVPILEIGASAPHSHYIVMEYVEGGTLGRLLVHAAETQAALPLPVGLRAVVDMLAGLQAAHDLRGDDGQSLGIVHRDVSPQNVLVGVDGIARLGDFGVARARGNLRTTRSGQLKGKLAYMAPEQARGDSDIDRRADVFAAGVVLWEVLTCRRLFRGDGEVDTLNKVMHLPIPPVRSVMPTVPAVLEAVVAKALQRDPEKRLGSAAELGEALERCGRVLGQLGTSWDVAAHVDAVLGAELKHQREAVRAWIGRSEPRLRASEFTPQSTTGVMARTTTSAPPTLSIRPRSIDARVRAFSWGWAFAAMGAFATVGAAAIGFRPRADDERGATATMGPSSGAEGEAIVASGPSNATDELFAPASGDDAGDPDGAPQNAYR
jgi:serine/threonine-protein kinase